MIAAGRVASESFRGNAGEVGGKTRHLRPNFRFPGVAPKERCMVALEIHLDIGQCEIENMRPVKIRDTL